MIWKREVPGHYTHDRYAIIREATTSGIRRASNPAWFVYSGPVRNQVPFRTLAQAKRYVEGGLID